MPPPPKKPNAKSKAQASDDSPKGDRHKASYQVRLPLAFKEHLERLALLHGDDASDRVREAVREYLQKHGLWPKSIGDLPGD